MPVEAPIQIPETRTALLLPTREIKRSVDLAHTLVRSLPETAFVESMTYGDPSAGSAWLVVPYLNEKRGIRLSRFTAQDGTLEIITVSKGFRSTKEIEGGIRKRVRTPSRIQLLTISGNGTKMELNTDIAQERMLEAIGEIQKMAGLIPTHETNPDPTAYR